MKCLPRNKYLSKSLVVVLVFLQVLALAPIAAFAAPPQPVAGKYDAALTEHDIRSRFGLSEDVEVVTDSEMSEIIELCHLIGAYLVRQDDGTLALRLENPNAVGVTRSFLDDYNTGLEEINELIKRGWLIVDDNFDLQPGSQLPATPDAIDAGLVEVEKQVAGEEVDTALPAGESPAYYSGGFMFSYHSGHHSVPYHYASLGPTFASTFHVGHYGGRFSLLFGLNRSFLHHTFYHGGYGYVPYYHSYHYGYNPFYYYPYHSSYYGWYHRNLYY